MLQLTNTNFTLILRDAAGDLTINVSKHILATKNLLTKFQGEKSVILVDHADIAYDVLMALHGQIVRSTDLPDWSYAFEYVKCCNNLGLDLVPPIKIPNEHFELFVEAISAIRYTDAVIRYLYKNLPVGYDAFTFGRELVARMLELSEYELIPGHPDLIGWWNDHVNNLEVTLYDAKYEITIGIHEYIINKLFPSINSGYRKRKRSPGIKLEVHNIFAAYDIIRSHYGHKTRSTRLGNLPDWHYEVAYIKCSEDWNLKYDTTSTKNLEIPESHFEFVIEIFNSMSSKSHGSGTLVGLLLKNLPKNYNLTKLPKNLVNRMLKLSVSDYRIAYICDDKFDRTNSNKLLNIYYLSNTRIIYIESRGTINIWDSIHNSHTKLCVSEHSILASACWPLRQQIIIVDSYNNIIIFDLDANHGIKFTFILPQNSCGIIFVCGSPNYNQIACGDSNGSVYIFDITNNHTSLLVQTICIGQNRLSCICYSPDGSQLVTGDEMGNVKIWNILDGHLVEEIHPQGDYPLINRHNRIRDIRFSPNGLQLAYVGFNNIMVFDVHSGEILYRQLVSDEIYHIDYSPNSDEILITTRYKIMKWHLADNHLITFCETTHPITGMCVVNFTNLGTIEMLKKYASTI